MNLDGPRHVHAWAPGRVNLIGDHTDYTGGLALPMAIQLGVSIEAARVPSNSIELVSDLGGASVSEPCVVEIGTPTSAATGWARYVAAVAHEARPSIGLRGTVRSTLPAGSGLSSSAALEIAVFLALTGHQPTSPAEQLGVALACQAAEHSATGVPCGLLDQLAILGGRSECATVVDAFARTATPVPMPAGLAVWVIHSGVARTLETSAYAQRRAECEAAEARIGPLRLAAPADAEALSDPVLRRRARHVVSENQRVRSYVEELQRSSGPDIEALGALSVESHRSLADDFAVSSPVLDELVDALLTQPGVTGARLTGAGFGGCVLAIGTPELDLVEFAAARSLPAWRMRPSAGAHVAIASVREG